MRGAIYGDLFISVHRGKGGEQCVLVGMCAQTNIHTRMHTHTISGMT